MGFFKCPLPDNWPRGSLSTHCQTTDPGVLEVPTAQQLTQRFFRCPLQDNWPGGSFSAHCRPRRSEVLQVPVAGQSVCIRCWQLPLRVTIHLPAPQRSLWKKFLRVQDHIIAEGVLLDYVNRRRSLTEIPKVGGCFFRWKLFLDQDGDGWLFFIRAPAQSSSQKGIDFAQAGDEDGLVGNGEEAVERPVERIRHRWAKHVVQVDPCCLKPEMERLTGCWQQFLLQNLFCFIKNWLGIKKNYLFIYTHFKFLP